MRSLPVVGLLAVLCASCIGGGPMIASTNKDFFASPPVVVEHRGRYALAFTQGSMPFFFQPKLAVVEGRLVVSVAATASSGMLAGRTRQIAIDDPSAIQAIDRGVFFWEPEPAPHGHLSRLVVLHEP